MKLEVIASPALLQPQHLENRSVVVLDILRATTTMTVALNNGAKEIRVYDSIESAAAAAGAFGGPKLLHGERRALPPPGFDLGNSPGDFTRDRCEGRSLFMTTTNGTVAVLAARAAPVVLIGAVVNAAAVAKKLVEIGHDVTLLCAGQRLDIALEDMLGCGAIIERLQGIEEVQLSNDAAVISRQLFDLHRDNLLDAFKQCVGCQSELRHGLMKDVEYCAVQDELNCVGQYDRVSESIKRID